MPVVIHEFEVVTEKPARTDAADAGAAKATPPSPSTPNDIERIVRRLRERAARVRAH